MTERKRNVAWKKTRKKDLHRKQEKLEIGDKLICKNKKITKTRKQLNWTVPQIHKQEAEAEKTLSD